MYEKRVGKIGERGKKLHFIFRRSDKDSWRTKCGSEGVDNRRIIFVIENVDLSQVNCERCLHALEMEKSK
jgi:hypothetical protein